MDFKQLQKAVANLNWNLSFHEFCREILLRDGLTGNETENLTEEELVSLANQRLENDPYCLEKWQDWQKLNDALHFFDDETLERIITVYEQRQTNR